MPNEMAMRLDCVPYLIQRSADIRQQDDILVYVAYCPNGTLSSLQRRSLAAYRAEGYRILLVVNSGADDHAMATGDSDAPILIVRENIGFDFGAWGHAARLVSGLENARSVTFTNDSLVGPLPGDGSAMLRDTVSDMSGDAVFMTESSQICHHGQSYFFAFRKRALEQGALDVIRGSLYFSDKRRVVLNEELTLASRLKARGISVVAAFPCPQAMQHGVNPTFFFWDYLVSTGFPFVKVSLIPDGRVEIDDPDLAAIIGPEFLTCLRDHLGARPAHDPMSLPATPVQIRR